MEDDWDLQAVVRGFFNTTTTTTTTSGANRIDSNTEASTMEDLPFSFAAPLSLCGGFQQEDGDNKLPCFPDLYEPAAAAATSSVLEELEQLYKPFVPKFQPISSAKTLPMSVTPVLQHQQQKQQQQKSAIASTSSTAHSHGPRPKRRKNQQKRVVCEVPAEGLSSDMWAWRKYGQKPIKGSPYPRGYYRCSSSKGCLARKQVERSRTDPSMFIITYTAEHNHPVPTHRNSLAGSTRHKLSAKSGTAINGDESSTPITSCTSNSKPSCGSSSSPTSTTDLSPSPTTPLMGSIIDEEIKEESRELDDEEMVDEDDDQDDQILIPGDDFFMGLDELVGPTSVNSSTTDPVIDDCFSDHFPANFPSSWFVNNATTAAGGS